MALIVLVVGLRSLPDVDSGVGDCPRTCALLVSPLHSASSRRVFGCVRVVFNDALRVRDEAYRAGVKLSDGEIHRLVITQAKKTAERSWLAEVASGVGAIGQRLTPRVAQLLRLPRWQTPGSQGRATNEIEEGSPAVISSDSQWIQHPSEWSVVSCEGGRGAGALVAGASERAIERHDHP
jgi:hypothetical protein